jgi:hypothetical protein
MPVSRDQFDQDLTAYVSAGADLIAADTDYIAAVDAFIGLQQIIDLSNEDAQVQAALANVNAAKDAVVAAKGRIPPPPPGP